MAVRAVFDVVEAGELTYFAPVASMPGFPKALARTLHELRLARIIAEQLASVYAELHKPRSVLANALRDIGRLLASVEQQLEHAGVEGRAALFRLASEA